MTPMSFEADFPWERDRWWPSSRLSGGISRNTRISDAAASTTWLGWVAASLLGGAVVMALMLYCSAEIRELNARRAALVQLARELDRERKSLDAQFAILGSDERIERIARDDLGMVRPAAGQRRLLP